MSQPARDSGFTLIEVMVTIALLGIVMAFAVSGWSRWTDAHEQSGAAQELQSTLRETQQRAVTEGAAMCVTFADTAYTVWRGSCASVTPTKLEGPIRIAAGVHIVPQDVPAGLTFSARGTATAGSVTVTSDSSSKVYTLTVEGFTGRVSLS